MFIRVSAYVFAVAASLAGCMGSGDVEYAGDVRVTSPELIEVEPGVQVVADADEPLFYSDGYYWLYRDDYWLRSDSYRGGFARVDVTYVPQRIRRIDRPQVYAQYRRHHGNGGYEARSTPRPTRSPTYNPGYRTPPPTTYTPPQRPYNVPTAPPPDTDYRPGRDHDPRTPLPAVPPPPTAPVTEPSDIHGSPMPPGHSGSVGRDVTPPVTPDRVPPAQEPNRVPPGHDRDRTPPGHQQRGDGPIAPGHAPERVERGNEDRDRGNDHDRGNSDHGNDHGNGRSEERNRKTEEKKDNGNKRKSDR